MNTRRSFLALLASVPFVGRAMLKRRDEPLPVSALPPVGPPMLAMGCDPVRAKQTMDAIRLCGDDDRYDVEECLRLIRDATRDLYRDAT